MASSYTPRSDTPGSGGLLRFTTVRDLQAAAMRRATTLAPVAGLQLQMTVNIPDNLPKGEVIAGLRRVGNNFGSRLVDEARKISKPTYKFGLFMSNWGEKTDVSETGKLSVTLRNPTPYANFVHRKGEKGRTVVETYIKPMIARRRSELVEDVSALIRRLLQRGRRRR